jgi:hypothetical protein
MMKIAAGVVIGGLPIALLLAAVIRVKKNDFEATIMFWTGLLACIAVIAAAVWL